MNAEQQRNEKVSEKMSGAKPVATRRRLPPTRERARRLEVQLRSERVELMLGKSSGWQVVPGSEGRAIDRVREFQSVQGAKEFAEYVVRCSDPASYHLDLFLEGERLLLTLQGPPRHGKPGDLTEAALQFAQQLG